MFRARKMSHTLKVTVGFLAHLALAVKSKIGKNKLGENCTLQSDKLVIYRAFMPSGHCLNFWFGIAKYHFNFVHPYKPCE